MFTIVNFKDANQQESTCVYGHLQYNGAVQKRWRILRRVYVSLAVSEAAFEPHQQFGDPGATEPRAFLQDVSCLYPRCKTYFTTHATLYPSCPRFALLVETCLTCIEFQCLLFFCNGFVTVRTEREIDRTDI